MTEYRITIKVFTDEEITEPSQLLDGACIYDSDFMGAVISTTLERQQKSKWIKINEK